jgi:hypothetical protein
MTIPTNPQRLERNAASSDSAVLKNASPPSPMLSGQLQRGSGQGQREHMGRTGQRHWFRITALPGWKRAQLGMPVFGKADCHPRPALSGAPPKKP